MDLEKKEEYRSIQKVDTHTAKVLRYLRSTTKVAVGKVLPGLMLCAGCTQIPTVAHMTLPLTDQKAEETLNKRIDTGINEILISTARKEVIQRAEEQDRRLNTSVTNAREENRSNQYTEHSKQVVDEKTVNEDAVPAVFVDTGANLELAKQTRFGQFFQQYIRSYSEEEQEHLLEHLQFLYHYEVDGTYLPYINKPLLRDGIRARITFETVLPKFSREEVEPYIQRAMRYLEEYTGIPVTFVEKGEEANLEIGLLGKKHGIEEDTRWVGKAYLNRGSIHGVEQHDVSFTTDINRMRISYDWDLETYIQDIYTQDTFQNLDPLGQEKLRMQLAEVTKEDILLRRMEETALHELLHLLGIAHKEDTTSVMNPVNHVTYIPEIGKEGDLIRSLFVQDSMNPKYLAKDPIYILVKGMKTYADQYK